MYTLIEFGKMIDIIRKQVAGGRNNPLVRVIEFLGVRLELRADVPLNSEPNLIIQNN